MNEKDWLERLKKEGEQLPVPEKLEPEAIREMLEQKGKKPYKWSHNWKRAAAVAAAILLILGGLMGVNSKKMPGAGLRGENSQLLKSEQKENYGQIYDALKTLSSDVYMDSNADFALLNKEALLTDMADTSGSAKGVARAESEETAVDIGEAQGETAAGDFSGTNVQTDKVDEGDIVKTDGDCIYTLDQNYNTITIVRARGKSMKKLSVISLGDEFFPREFYIKGNKLSVLGGLPEDSASEKTAVYTYDISDRENPEKAGTVTQSGSFISSRMQGNHLYVFSSFYPTLPESKDKTEDYIPQVDGKILELPGIIVPKNPESPGYLVMTAIDLEKPDRSSDRQAVLSAAESFYVSQENIYAASAAGQDRRNTEIRKFSYGSGKIRYESKGSVKGYLESSFSMDEYKGNLRLVTTLDTVSGGTYNNVYVLDKNMKTLGSILKLAKDERIYSARFMGDEGYFVTFRETDPLFSVDFSNPAEPKIIGQLKIPGFSEYLHFYGENKLLGVGMDANEEGEIGGIKLSMFNTKNPKNVKEEKKYVLKAAYDAEVLTNHHAILIDPEKNLFGFAVSGDESAEYYLFRYDKKKGFQPIFNKTLDGSGYGVRGLYMGNTFYLVQDNEIAAYSMDSFEKLARISI